MICGLVMVWAGVFVFLKRAGVVPCQEMSPEGLAKTKNGSTFTQGRPENGDMIPARDIQSRPEELCGPNVVARDCCGGSTV